MDEDGSEMVKMCATILTPRRRKRMVRTINTFSPL